MSGIATRFIEWATRRVPIQPVVTFGGKPLFDRYEILRWDEWPDSWWDSHKEQCHCCFCGARKRRPRSLPWWLPFNLFLHNWKAKIDEEFHDHPRWSITLCLKGKIIERTPWGERTLTPGSIVVRSAKTIHGFKLPKDAGDVWTLFIVGRRKHRQNTYRITKR